MRILLFGLLALHCLTSPAGADEAKKGLDALQGVWKLTAQEANGQTQEAGERAPWFQIKGNRVFYGGEVLAELTIADAAAPPSIDVEFRDPERTVEGIYKIDGDTFKICVNRQTEGVKERPTGFATEGKPEWRLLVLQRDKTERKDPTEGLPGFVGLALKLDDDKVVVTDVIKDSPAQKAGMKAGDVLLKVAGQDATDLGQTIAAVRQTKPGTEITVRIRRGDKEQDVPIKVRVMPFMVLD